MAQVIGTPALSLGTSVTIKSFGHNYTGIVTELKARTAMIRYVNKGGTTYDMRVKRTDIAGPTAEQQAATAQGVEVRRLRVEVRDGNWRERQIAWFTTTVIERDLATENAQRAEYRAQRNIADSAEFPGVNTMTAERWAKEQEEARTLVAQWVAELAGVRARLAELGK